MPSLTKSIEHKIHKGIYYNGPYSIFRGKYKTARLIINRNKEIIFKCSNRISIDKISQFITKKEIWIKNKLNNFQKYFFKNRENNFVSGEEIFLLSKQYKLLIHNEAEEDIVKVDFGIINIYCKNKKAKVIYESFIKIEQEKIFNELYEKCKILFDYKNFPPLYLRKMKGRWGSFQRKGNIEKITLNTNLIKYSKECINYVIIHELCHKVEGNHKAGFYNLLSKKLPNWKKYKEELKNIC